MRLLKQETKIYSLRAMHHVKPFGLGTESIRGKIVLSLRHRESIKKGKDVYHTLQPYNLVNPYC